MALQKKTIFGAQKIAFPQLYARLVQCDSIAEEVASITEAISLKPHHLAARVVFVQKLTNVVRSLCGAEFDCVLFGSSVTGLGWEDSDLDVRILFPDQRFPDLTEDDKTSDNSDESVKKISYLLQSLKLNGKKSKDFITTLKQSKGAKQKHRKLIESLHSIVDQPNVFQSVVIVGKGRVTHLRMNFASHPVEISCCPGDVALRNSSFVRKLCHKPDLRNVLTALQWIFKTSSFYRSQSLPKLSSYVTFCICTASLCSQFPQFKLQFLELLNDESVDVDSIDFNLDLAESISRILAVLSTADFSVSVFSPLLGDIVPFTRLFIPAVTECFTLGHLNVQDPFEPDHNISSLVPEMKRWKNEFSRLKEAFGHRRRLHDLYSSFEGNLKKPAEAVESPSDSSRYPFDPTLSDLGSFPITPTPQQLPVKSKASFHEWCLEVATFLDIVAATVLLANINGKSPILGSEGLDDEDCKAPGSRVWPVFFDITLNHNTWQDRRAIRKKISKNCPASLKQEQLVSQEMTQRGVKIDPPIKCVLLLQPDDDKNRLMFTLKTHDVESTKKYHLFQTLSNFLPSLCEKYISTE